MVSRTPRIRVLVIGSAVLTLAVASAGYADTFTFATFADPATSSNTPLFTYASDTLTGGWSGSGLTLRTPGLPAYPDYSNATFALVPSLTVTAGLAGPGRIDFFDETSTLLMSMSFQKAQLVKPFLFGASDLVVHDVVISGPIIATPLSDESFTFSFANQKEVGGVFTATASFTSSAAPEPAALALLAVGGLLLRRRRRA